MSVPWAITPEKVREAVQRVIGVARPRKVILFGSAALGETSLHSDLDILVVSEKRLKELADQPGLIYREALRRGKVVYDTNE